MSKIINWIDKGYTISLRDIINIAKKLQISFPLNYLKIITDHNEGTPEKDSFTYFDVYLDRKTISGIGAFIPFKHTNYSSVESLVLSPSEGFTKELIPFAEPGNGDLICFDYRAGKDILDPPIVYWNHEAEEGKDISFIAHNFEEFLNLLQEPEDNI